MSVSAAVGPGQVCVDFRGKAVPPVIHLLPERAADAKINLQGAGPREPRPPSLQTAPSIGGSLLPHTLSNLSPGGIGG